MNGHREPRPADAEVPARGRGEEERVEEDVGRAEVRGAAAGDDERDRDGRVDLEVVRGDRLRRPAPDGDRVDERDDERDEDDPGQLLEEPEERPAGEDRRPELREVRGEPPVAQAEDEREQREHDRRRDEQPAASTRAAARADEQQRRRHARTTETITIAGHRSSRPRCGATMNHVHATRRAATNGRDGGAAPQYGGSRPTTSPSTLKAFQNAVFAGCSSSDSSMSGVTSAWIVGVKLLQLALRSARARARAGTRRELRNATRRARPSRRRASAARCAARAGGTAATPPRHRRRT